MNKKKTVLHIIVGIIIGLLIAGVAGFIIFKPFDITFTNNLDTEETQSEEAAPVEPEKEVVTDETLVSETDENNVDLYYFLIQGNYKTPMDIVPGGQAYFCFKDNREYAGFSTDLPYDVGTYEITRENAQYFVTIKMSNGKEDKYELIFPNKANTIILKTKDYQLTCEKIDEMSEATQ